MILVYGTVCLDRVMRVPRIPEIGGYVAIQDEQVFLGGEAANTANALHAWGAEVLLVPNQLGGGAEGELLRRLLAEKGLSTPDAGQQGRAPVCDVYVTPDGERTMFGRGFSDMGPSLEAAEIPYTEGALFTAEPNMSEPSRAAAREAQRRGMRTYLMDFIREDDPIGPGVYWQCSTDWVGTRGDIAANIDWLRRFINRTQCSAILTDGARGIVCGSPVFPARHFPAFPVDHIVDSTGAGDAFRAGMLYGLEQKWPVRRCLAFASAAGALECQEIGATTRVPSLEEIERHIRRHPGVAAAFEEQ